MFTIACDRAAAELLGELADRAALACGRSSCRSRPRRCRCAARRRCRRARRSRGRRRSTRATSSVGDALVRRRSPRPRSRAPRPRASASATSASLPCARSVRSVGGRPTARRRRERPARDGAGELARSLRSGCGLPNSQPWPKGMPRRPSVSSSSIVSRPSPMMRAPIRSASDWSARSRCWRARVLVDLRAERAVDLDELGPELHHRLEARVARAGVVERDLEAELAVVVAHLAEHVEVLDRLLLRDLEHHVAGRELAALRACARAPRRGSSGRGSSVGRTFRNSLAPPGRSRAPSSAALAAQAVELEHQILLARRSRTARPASAARCPRARARAPRSRTRCASCTSTIGS